MGVDLFFLDRCRANGAPGAPRPAGGLSLFVARGGGVLIKSKGNVVSQEGASPTGLISADISPVGEAPSWLTTKQESSPERLTGCDHPNCPKLTLTCFSLTVAGPKAHPARLGPLAAEVYL